MSTENDAAAVPPTEPATTAVTAAPAPAVAPVTPQDATAAAPQAPAAELAGEPAPPATTARPELSPAQCAEQLAALFPALFGTQGPPRPLKLRIQADIQQRAPGQFTRKALSIVLHRHTTSTPYLKALVAAPSRFDLDGQPAGEIAEEHRQAAREEVERRRALVAARRAAQGPARGPREARKPGEAREPRKQGEPREARTDRPPRHAGRPADGPGRPRPGEGGTPGREQQAAHQRLQQDPRQMHRESPRNGPRQGPRQESVRAAPPEPARPQPAPASQAQAALPEDPARRERALLLRTYEASPLTKANFCVLKRISESELDAQLALARQERGERPARR